MRKYSTDLTDSQWAKTGRFFVNRKRKHSLREIVNALLYITKTGVQWRFLSHHYPEWQLVYCYFRRWTAEGLIEESHDCLRGLCHKKAGRNKSPGLGLLDSQSVKTSSVTTEKGYDAGKKVNGRKRHIITDTVGFVLAAVIHSANIQDRDGAELVLKELQYKYPLLKKIMADGGYKGALIAWTLSVFGWTLETVSKAAGTSTFPVIPKRWVAERTFGWFNFNRIPAKDYETLSECSMAFVHLTMIRIMLNRRMK
jgi:putative transposase